MKMDGKTVLITGGNAGIGKHTAIGLAKMGAKVVIVSRDAHKGAEAIKEIIQASGNTSVEMIEGDLASFDSVGKIAATFLGKHSSLDVLINNAGAFYTEYSTTTDGFERQWQINHLSGFLLTHLLLPAIKKSPKGRIINVSSKGHYKGYLYFKDLNRSKKYNGLAAYAQSKLANVAFTIALSERLKDTGITVNALHPGVVRTSIGNKNNSSWIGKLWSIGKMFMISEEDGAKTSIYLASSHEVDGVTGAYFDNCKIQVPNPSAIDKTVQDRLWEESLKQTGISVFGEV